MTEANNGDIGRKWLVMIETSSSASAAQELVSTFRNNEPCSVVQRFDKGAYNYCFKLRFDSDGEEWILRLPKPGQVMDPVKKITDEVAVMKFIHNKTKIPIPTIIAYSLDKSSDLGLFIIMEFIESTRLDQLLVDDNEMKPFNLTSTV
jgi:aminoglycoside phosphotransferase (APT) family kinase protein